MTAEASGAAPLCRPPQPVGVPKSALPAGTCDTHFHVFGAPARYPLDPRRNYTPHVATLDQYRAVMAVCGIDRAVLVQPSVYGRDNRCLLDALRSAAGRGDAFRGVVVPDAAASDEELLAMHALGVRGIRLNLVNPQMLGVDAALALCGRMRRHGWHLQVQLMLDGDGAATLAHLADRADVPLVVDHFGRPALGEPMPILVELLQSGRLWVKLSAPYRTSREAPPAHADMTPLVHALVDANPDRLLWGSDWPHTELAATPHDADLVDLLASWLPDAAMRERICVANPARLYGFRGPP